MRAAGDRERLHPRPRPLTHRPLHPKGAASSGSGPFFAPFMISSTNCFILVIVITLFARYTLYDAVRYSNNSGAEHEPAAIAAPHHTTAAGHKSLRILQT